MPSQRYGLPLTPVADCCRTARHALAAIARARPGVFVTSVAKEIARYNTLATNAQTLNVNLTTHVLTRSKAEVGIILGQKKPVALFFVAKPPLRVYFSRNSGARDYLVKGL